MRNLKKKKKGKNLYRVQCNGRLLGATAIGVLLPAIIRSATNAILS